MQVVSRERERRDGGKKGNCKRGGKVASSPEVWKRVEKDDFDEMSRLRREDKKGGQFSRRQ